MNHFELQILMFSGIPIVVTNNCLGNCLCSYWIESSWYFHCKQIQRKGFFFSIPIHHSRRNASGTTWWKGLVLTLCFGNVHKCSQEIYAIFHVLQVTLILLWCIFQDIAPNLEKLFWKPTLQSHCSIVCTLDGNLRDSWCPCFWEFSSQYAKAQDFQRRHPWFLIKCASFWVTVHFWNSSLNKHRLTE